MYQTERQRTVSINCSKMYYHSNDGKYRKAVAYYTKKHPELNIDEFFADIDPGDWSSKNDKIRAYHNETKIAKIKAKFLAMAN